MFNHFVVADSPEVRPKPGEVLVWVGSGTDRRACAHVLSIDEAIDLVGEAAEVSVALARPLPFLQRLAVRRSALSEAA